MTTDRIKVTLRIVEERYREKLEAYLADAYNDRVEIAAEEEDGYVITDEVPEGKPRHLYLAFGEAGEDQVSAYRSVKDIVFALFRLQNKEEALRAKRMSGGAGKVEETETKSLPAGVLHETDPKYGSLKRFGNLTCVYSPVGGCGKTTFALAYAKALADKYPDRKILVECMEGISDWPVYYRSDSRYSLSDLLYCLLMEEENWEECLWDSVTRQDEGRFFMRPCQCAEDISGLAEADLVRLFDLLFQFFDHIVLDMNTSFDAANRRLFEISGERFLLMGDHESDAVKMRAFLEAFRRNPEKAESLGRNSRLFVVGNAKKTLGAAAMEGLREERLPYCTRLYKEAGGRRRLREDSDYYESVCGILP